MIKFPRKLLQPIENYLKGEEAKAKKTLKDLKSEDPFTDPGHVDDNAASDTEATEQSSHERIESLMHELTIRLEKIKNALFRIKKGKYGNCENCGKMISTERLAIMPTATLCVSCERKNNRPKSH